MPRKTTRNPQGGGTIRRRSDGRWEARFTVGRDPGTGKQVQKSVYGKTQAEVRKKLQAACSALDNGLYIEQEKITLGQWLDIWLEAYVKKEVKPLTFKTYQEQCSNHLKPSLGAVRLSALNAHSIQTMYNKLEAGTKEKPGLSPKTIKNIHGVLHKGLAKAEELRYIPFNPSAACTLPRMERKEIKPLEESTIADFLGALEKKRFQNLFLVTLFTGMREGEILGLTWGCVDFEQGTVTVSQQLQKEKNGDYYFISPKSGKKRVIVPAPFVMKVLQNEKHKQTANRLKAGSVWNNPPNLVFTDEIGKNLVPRTIIKHFKRIACEIGIPEARFHDLRHTYAVTSLQEGDDIKTVQENLGHATAAFTLDVYGHVTEKMKTESAARMEAFIKNCKGSIKGSNSA